MRGSRAWRIGAVSSLPAATCGQGKDLHRHPGRLRGPQGPLDELGGGLGMASSTCWMV